MVSAVILLFTVSTLVAHTVTIPTKELNVQHACKGQTLCDVKPDNYPQEMIDNLVKENLHHLRRMKRQTYSPDVNNNCVNSTKTQKFYSHRHLKELTGLIVQSELYTQKITTVTCNDEAGSCFQNNGVNSRCRTIYTPVKIVMLNAKGKLKVDKPTLPTGCVCSNE